MLRQLFIGAMLLAVLIASGVFSSSSASAEKVHIYTHIDVQHETIIHELCDLCPAPCAADPFMPVSTFDLPYEIYGVNQVHLFDAIIFDEPTPELFWDG